jgi:hypothetical protein
MSLAVDRRGWVYVLDQVNKRVVVHDASGRRRRRIVISSATTEDMVLTGNWLWTLILEPGANPGFRVERHSTTGEGPSLPVALNRDIQLVTGIFASGDPDQPDLWVEQRHERQTQVVERGQPLGPDRQRHAELGRPDRSRPGLRLTAVRSGRHRARVLQVVPGRHTRKVLDVNTQTSIVAIEALETDERGGVFLQLLLGRPTRNGLVDTRRVLVVIHGQRRLVVELQARDNATDGFRRLAVGHDGAVYQLSTSERGVEVRRLRLPEGGQT